MVIFNFIIMKKEIFMIAIKLLILFWLFLLGILALTSCSSSHYLEGSGKTTIVTTDTTYIYHGGALKIK